MKRLKTASCLIWDRLERSVSFGRTGPLLDYNQERKYFPSLWRRWEEGPGGNVLAVNRGIRKRFQKEDR